METIIYVIIFIIGALFGSFFTLATYRIPKHQDILHTRSYCPKCDHKLGFFDMFPILSYIFLGGKCRYCKNKISPRYILLEILSGFVFVTIFYLMKIDLTNVYELNYLKICEFLFMTLFISFVFITAGIDVENRKIEKGVTIYGIIISLIYIAYLCIVEKANIYRYAIYIALYILLLILDTITLRKFAKNSYIIGVLFTLITMAIFTSEFVLINTIIITCLSIAFYILFNKIKMARKKIYKTDKQICKDLKIAFFLCTANIISIILVLLR